MLFCSFIINLVVSSVIGDVHVQSNSSDAAEEVNCLTECTTNLAVYYQGPTCTFFGENLTRYQTILHNFYCPSVNKTLTPCLGRFGGENQGMLYVGDCGCPQNCQDPQGKCVENKCVCQPGYFGESCFWPKNCSVNDKPAPCVCPSPSQSLNDCSGGEWKNIKEPNFLIPGARYTKWEKYGSNHPLFQEATVSQIYLTTNQTTLQFLLSPENKDERTYFDALSMQFLNRNASFQFPTKKLPEVAKFRTKGANSRNFVHKSWAIKLPQKEYQVNHFNLKAAEMDNTFIREMLVIRFLRAMNSPTYRGSFTQIFINNQFFGGGILLEHLNKEFLKSRFNNSDGPFFKCTGNLTYECDTWCKEYEEKYDLKEGDQKLGQKKMIQLLTIINNSDPSNLNDLENIFDIEMFLRAFSVEVLTSNWDGIMTANNFEMYWDPDRSKWVYFRHDLDIAMQVGTGTDSIWIREDKVRVAWLIIHNAKWQVRYRELLTLGVSYMQSDAFKQEIQDLHNLAAPLLAKDYWRGVDLPNTLTLFNGGPLALTSWCQRRGANIIEQLKSSPIS